MSPTPNDNMLSFYLPAKGGDVDFLKQASDAGVVNMERTLLRAEARKDAALEDCRQLVANGRLDPWDDSTVWETGFLSWADQHGCQFDSWSEALAAVTAEIGRRERDRPGVMLRTPSGGILASLKDCDPATIEMGVEEAIEGGADHFDPLDGAPGTQTQTAWSHAAAAAARHLLRTADVSFAFKSWSRTLDRVRAEVEARKALRPIPEIVMARARRAARRGDAGQR